MGENGFPGENGVTDAEKFNAMKSLIAQYYGSEIAADSDMGKALAAADISTNANGNYDVDGYAVRTILAHLADKFNSTDPAKWYEVAGYIVSLGNIARDRVEGGVSELTDTDTAFFEAMREYTQNSITAQSEELKQEAEGETPFSTISRGMTESFFRPIVGALDTVATAAGLDATGRDYGGEIGNAIQDTNAVLPYVEGYQPWMSPISSAGQSVASLAGAAVVGKGVSVALGAISELVGTAIATDTTLLANPALQDTSLLGKLAPNDLLKGMLVTQFDDSYRKYKGTTDESTAVISATLEAVGMTYIEGLGGIGAASGENMAAGIAKTQGSTLKKIFSGLAGYGGQAIEELGEEAAQAFLQSTIEGLTTGQFDASGNMQQFSVENAGSTAFSIAATTLLFYLVGLPAEIGNVRYQSGAQTLLNNIADAYANNDVAALQQYGLEVSKLANDASATLPVKDAQVIAALDEKLRTFMQNYTAQTPQEQAGTALNSFQQRYASGTPAINTDAFYDQYLVDTQNGEISVPELPQQPVQNTRSTEYTTPTVETPQTGAQSATAASTHTAGAAVNDITGFAKDDISNYRKAVDDLRKTRLVKVTNDSMNLRETVDSLEQAAQYLEEKAGTKIEKPSIATKGLLPSEIEAIGKAFADKKNAVAKLRQTAKEIRARQQAEVSAASKKLVDTLKRERKGKKLTREYRTLIDETLEKIDTKALSMTDESRAELEALQQYAKEAYTDKGLEIPKSLQGAYKRLNQTQVSNLSVDDIQALTDQILEAKKQDQIDRKEAKTLKDKTYAEAEKSFSETRPNKTKWDLTSWAENPQTWALNFGKNFRKNVIDPIQNGAITHGRNEWYVNENILKPLQKITEKEFGNKRYGRKNATTIKEPTLGVELKPHEILDVYSAAMDIDGFDALVNDELYDPVKLQTFVKNFEKNYPQYFKAYELLRKLFDYYEPQTNATFNHTKGHDLITEQKKKDNPDYYPLHKDGFYYHTPTEGADSVNTTPSFTFARTGGGKIDLVNPLWVARTYHDQANRYVSYSAALHDANILMQSETVQNMISEAANNKEQAKKISGFMREYLYAVARGDTTKNTGDKFIQSARSRVSGAILTANIEVAAKQVASYFGALEHIGAKYLLNPKNFFQAIKSIATKEGRSRLYEAFPDLYERIEEGYLMAESGKLKGRAKLVRMVDAFTVSSIANAAKLQADGTGGDASEIFHRALWDTQPMYDSAFRSSVQRSEVARWFLQFSTQQFQQQNQVKRAVKYFQQGDKAAGTKALIGIALNIASFSAMAFGFVKAFPKKDDKDKTDWKLFLEQIAKATTGTTFPILSRVLGGLPNDFIKMLGGDFDVTSGYDISSPVIDEIINATNAFSTLNGDKTIYGKIIDAAKPFLILAGVPAANAEKWLSRTAEVIFPDFEYDYWKKEATASQLFDDYMNGREFPSTLPSSRTAVYDAYFDLISSGTIDPEQLSRLVKVSNAISDTPYDEKVDDMVSALGNRYRNQYEEEHPEWTEEQVNSELEKLMPSLIEYAQDFYDEQYPLNNVDAEIRDMLSGLYEETGDSLYLLDDDTFTLNGNEYEYPDDIQTSVVEGYTTTDGEEIDGLDDVTSSAWFQREDADAQEQIIRDTINSVFDAIEHDVVYDADPAELARLSVEPDTSTYYGFNEYWQQYDPNDDVIVSLDAWGVYPHRNTTFSYDSVSYEFTDAQQESMADTTYTALRKYYSRLDAASADKIIERIYAAFKEYIANGREVNTDEILSSVYTYMDEKYEWS